MRLLCSALLIVSLLAPAGAAEAPLARGDLAAALTVLHREGLDPVQVFLSRRGVYREVAP